MLDLAKTTIEFFLNAELNRIFLVFGMLLFLLSMLNIEQWVKLKRFSRIILFIFGIFFMIGSVLGITNDETKVLTKAKEKIRDIETKKEEELANTKREEELKINEEKERIEAEKKKIEKDKKELERKKSNRAITPKDSQESSLDESESIESFCLENNSEYGYGGKLTFYNQSGNKFEFTGVIGYASVGGVISVSGNEISIINSSNAKGKLTLMDNCNRLLGTIKVLDYGLWKNSHVDIEKLKKKGS